MEFENPYIVYVKPNSSGYISAVNSSAFLNDTTGWEEIDNGYSDKYHHAQGNYLAKSLYDDRGIHRYKYYGGKVIERTQEEMDADYVPPVEKLSSEERIESLESTTNDLILMMARLIGGEN